MVEWFLLQAKFELFGTCCNQRGASIEWTRQISFNSQSVDYSKCRIVKANLSKQKYWWYEKNATQTSLNIGLGNYGYF